MPRKSYRKTHVFKTGQRIELTAKRVRKLYYRCEYGKLELTITGDGPDRIVEIEAGEAGGPWGPGGGAYDWGNITTMFQALTPSKCYIHLEWNTGFTFPFAPKMPKRIAFQPAKRK